MADYRMEEYFDGTMVPVCLTQADTFWPAFFFILSIVLFFFLPCMILVILYTIIARHLMKHPGIIAPCRHHRHLDHLRSTARPTNATHHHHSALRYRKQVVLMLATVVFAFFVCLMPFRALTLWIIVVSDETKYSLDVETYYNLLYFSRIMIYINSSINPILYNLMSSKFREGFLKLCYCHHTKHHRLRGDVAFSQRKGTFNTTSTATTTCSSNLQNSIRSSPQESFWRLGLARKSSSSSTSSSTGNKATGSLKVSVRSCGVISSCGCSSPNRSFHRTNSSSAAVGTERNGNNNNIKSGQQMLLQRSKSHSLSHHHRIVCDAIDEVGTVKTTLVMPETSKADTSLVGVKSEESYV